MPTRRVISESWKWRSGRVLERTVAHCASGRGGKDRACSATKKA
jgi:hypothetical protein